jgi:hypothetical protein
MRKLFGMVWMMKNKLVEKRENWVKTNCTLSFELPL